MAELPSELLQLLTAWEQPLSQIRSALLDAATPAQLIHIHAPFNANLFHAALLGCLQTNSASNNKRAVFVDARVHNSPTNIYDTILNTVASHSPPFDGVRSANWSGQSEEANDEEEDLPSGLTVRANESLPTFIETLQGLYDSGAAEKLLIVFGHAHLLASMNDNAEAAQFDGSFLASLSRLRELSQRNVVPIFVSEWPYHKYRPPMGRAVEPGSSNTVFIPPLSKSDILSVIKQSRSTSTGDQQSNETDTFETFLGLVYDTFISHLPSNDTISEIAHLASGHLWQLWQAHASKGAGAAAIAIRPAMTLELDKIGLPTKLKQESQSTSTNDSKLKLSRVATFLLLATYVASHNPARTDVRMFAVFEELSTPSPRKKGRAPSSSPRKGRKTNDAKRLTGPKSCPVERVLAIFHCMWDDMPHTIASSADILSELATLIGLRLITRTSKGGNEPTLEHLQNVKLKINIGWDQIKSLAEGVRFAVGDRMWDVE